MTLFTTKASFGKRLLSSILDWVAVFIIAMPVLLLYLFPLGYANMQELASPEMDAWVIGIKEWRSGYIGMGISLLTGLIGLFYVILEPVSSPCKASVAPTNCSKTALLVIGDFSCSEPWSRIALN